MHMEDCQVDQWEETGRKESILRGDEDGSKLHIYI
jgi:hypothetical protein